MSTETNISYSNDLALMKEKLSKHNKTGGFLGGFSLIFALVFIVKRQVGVQNYMCKLLLIIIFNSSFKAFKIEYNGRYSKLLLELE